MSDGEASDEECRANTIPPVMSLQGHSAPLGITFYRWKDPKDRPGKCPSQVAFPREMDGYAFIAYHGSWNRDIPTGYKVVYVEMDENGEPSGTGALDLLAHQPPNARWESGLRPVDVDFDECGRLLVSSDGSRPNYRGSGILRMEYAPGTFAPSDSTSVAPTSNGASTSGSSIEGFYPVEPDMNTNDTSGEEEIVVERDGAVIDKASPSDPSAFSPTTGSQIQTSSGSQIQTSSGIKLRGSRWWDLAMQFTASFALYYLTLVVLSWF